MTLNILYQDPWFVAIYKPANLFVHRTKLGRDRHTAMSLLRNQLDQWVYPIHRLDRATAGVLLFGLSKEASAEGNRLFREREVNKTYHAVVRGYPPAEGMVDRPLRENPEEERRPSLTRYRCLHTIQLNIPVGKWPTARYALLEINPETGRRHQIRKHCNHMAHPIVGDAVYGDRFHNRLFREQFRLHRLMLFSVGLEFTHPFSGESVAIKSAVDLEIQALYGRFHWQL